MAGSKKERERARARESGSDDKWDNTSFLLNSCNALITVICFHPGSHASDRVHSAKIHTISLGIHVRAYTHTYSLSFIR